MLIVYKVFKIYQKTNYNVCEYCCESKKFDYKFYFHGINKLVIFFML